MGWHSGWYSRRDLIRHLVRAWNNGDTEVSPLRHCTRGNNLWILFEQRAPGIEPERWVELCMMQRFAGDEWGYKPVEDSMGPYQVNCPLSYVEACTATESKLATEWRERVREYWKEKNDRRATDRKGERNVRQSQGK